MQGLAILFISDESSMEIVFKCFISLLTVLRSRFKMKTLVNLPFQGGMRALMIKYNGPEYNIKDYNDYR